MVILLQKGRGQDRSVRSDAQALSRHEWRPARARPGTHRRAYRLLRGPVALPGTSLPRNDAPTNSDCRVDGRAFPPTLARAQGQGGRGMRGWVRTLALVALPGLLLRTAWAAAPPDPTPAAL